jgi:6-phosphofructokinase
MGYYAVEFLKEGASKEMVALQSSKITKVPLNKVLSEKKKLDTKLIKIVNILS